MIHLIIILLLILLPSNLFADCNYYTKCNRINALVGTGPNSLKTEKNKETKETEITQQNGVVFGLEYERSLRDNQVIGIQVLSNETYLIKVGRDF